MKRKRYKPAGGWRRFRYWFQIVRWLKAPLYCKLGFHIIGPDADCGMSCLGDTEGYMDIWCLDCDTRLKVPIDDVIHYPVMKEVIDDVIQIRREAK